MFKKIIFFIFSLMMFFVLINPVQAQIGIGYAGNLGLQEAEEADPRDMAVEIVRYLMTFLGIIAVTVILLGGFKWMTSAGNEDKVAEAKQLIVSGVIGLIIILAAFAIVQFIVTMTGNALSGDF